MAKKRKRAKRKVLYHRLALVIAIVVLLVYLVVGMGVKIYQQWFAETDAQTEEKVVDGKVKKVDNSQHKKVIVIDPGHGGYDAGSQSQDGVNEKDVTLEIALATGAYIESQRDDVMVLYTREDDDYYWTSDVKTDLFYRVNTAIENDATLFMSIHLNSNEDTTQVRGHEIWASLTSAENETFAYTVEEKLNDLNYNECRGVKDESVSNLLVLHYNTVPSVLVELGYINNIEDFAYINSKKGQKAIAKALGDGMIETLNEFAQ